MLETSILKRGCGVVSMVFDLKWCKISSIDRLKKTVFFNSKFMKKQGISVSIHELCLFHAAMSFSSSVCKLRPDFSFFLLPCLVLYLFSPLLRLTSPWLWMTRASLSVSLQQAQEMYSFLFFTRFLQQCSSCLPAMNS